MMLLEPIEQLKAAELKSQETYWEAIRRIKEGAKNLELSIPEEPSKAPHRAVGTMVPNLRCATLKRIVENASFDLAEHILICYGITIPQTAH